MSAQSCLLEPESKHLDIPTIKTSSQLATQTKSFANNVSYVTEAMLVSHINLEYMRQNCVAVWACLTDRRHVSAIRAYLNGWRTDVTFRWQDHHIDLIRYHARGQPAVPRSRPLPVLPLILRPSIDVSLIPTPFNLSHRVGES